MENNDLVVVLEDAYFELETRDIDRINPSNILRTLLSLLPMDENIMNKLINHPIEDKLKVINLINSFIKKINSPKLNNSRDVIFMCYLMNRLHVYSNDNPLTYDLIKETRQLFNNYMSNYADFAKTKEADSQEILILYAILHQERQQKDQAKFDKDKITLDTIDLTVKQIEDHQDKQNAKGGCYIATMVYSSYEAPEVVVLREFRDNKLKKFKMGRIFISTYYFISPKLIEIFGDIKLFRRLCKIATDYMVRIITTHNTHI